MRYVRELSAEEKEALALALRQWGDPAALRRARAVRLSSRGWTVPKIAEALNFSLPYDFGWHDFSFLTIRADGYEPSAIAGHTFGSRSGLTGQPLERLVNYSPLDPVGIPDGGDWAYPFIFVSRSSSEPSAEEAGR